MGILAGEPLREDDFESASTGAASKIPVTLAGGRLSKTFLPIDTLYAAVKKIFSTTTEVVMTNGQSAADTPLASGTIPAGSLGTANAIRFKLYFSGLNLNSGTALTIYCKYGGQTVAALSIANISNPNVRGIVEGEIVADGATGAQKGFAELRAYAGGVEKASDANIGFTKIIAVDHNMGLTVDSSVDKTLAFSAQYNTSGAANDDLTFDLAIVELITA